MAGTPAYEFERRLAQSLERFGLQLVGFAGERAATALAGDLNVLWVIGGSQARIPLTAPFDMVVIEQVLGRKTVAYYALARDRLGIFADLSGQREIDSVALALPLEGIAPRWPPASPLDRLRPLVMRCRVSESYLRRILAKAQEKDRAAC
jgi:hypothetical protein